MNAPLLPTPCVDELVATRDPKPCWTVPVEMAVACTSPAFKRIIWHRMGQGERAHRNAIAYPFRGRFFAVVFFYDATDLLIPLDVHTLENQP
jgi:hypothetical protein